MSKPELSIDDLRKLANKMSYRELVEIVVEAIVKERKDKFKIFVTKDAEGNILVVTRQDSEGQIIEVIAEATASRAEGKVVPITDELRHVYENTTDDDIEVFHRRVCAAMFNATANSADGKVVERYRWFFDKANITEVKQMFLQHEHWTHWDIGEAIDAAMLNATASTSRGS